MFYLGHFYSTIRSSLVHKLGLPIPSITKFREHSPVKSIMLTNRQTVMKTEPLSKVA